jgi:hypothetical protein
VDIDPKISIIKPFQKLQRTQRGMEGMTRNKYCVETINQKTSKVVKG